MRIEPNYYRLIHAVTSKNDIREYLQYALFDPKTDRAYASDGHRAVSVPIITEHEDGEELVAVRLRDAPAARLTDITVHIPVCDEETCTATFYSNKNRMVALQQSKKLAESFPLDTLRKILATCKKNNGTRTEVGVNPELLADMTKALKVAGVKLTFGESDSPYSSDPIRVEFVDSEPAGLGLIEACVMPMRVD